MKIYVGNIPYSVDDEGLRSAFASFGEISEAGVAVFRKTGLSRGFGFVTMPDDDEANKAIAALNGSEMGGRTIQVREALPSRREAHDNAGGSDRPFHGKRGRGGRRRHGRGRWQGGDRGESVDRRW